jgi:hypothetical protein
MPRLQRTHPLVPYAYNDEHLYGSSHVGGAGAASTSAGRLGGGAGSGSGSDRPVNPPTSIRKIYIQHLVDILHSCLSKGDHTRARRAWAILIRCREVDWYERWRWGLAVLQADIQAHLGVGAGMGVNSGGLDEVEDWLKTLRLSAVEVEVSSVPCSCV